MIPGPNQSRLMSTEIKSATCTCGQLTIKVSGEPVTVSTCHCFDCQKRTGSVLGVQARYKKEQVEVSGEAKPYERTGDTGAKVTFQFCPTCGTTMFWNPEKLPDYTIVAVGAFSDPEFRHPDYSVYEDRRHKWLEIIPEMEHYD